MHKHLTPKLRTLLLMAAKDHGTYDPEVCLVSIEEQFNRADQETAIPFLAWVHEHNRPFGHGNIDARYREFLEWLNTKNMTPRPR